MTATAGLVGMLFGPGGALAGAGSSGSFKRRRLVSSTSMVWADDFFTEGVRAATMALVALLTAKPQGGFMFNKKQTLTILVLVVAAAVAAQNK